MSFFLWRLWAPAYVRHCWWMCSFVVFYLNFVEIVQSFTWNQLYLLFLIFPHLFGLLDQRCPLKNILFVHLKIISIRIVRFALFFDLFHFDLLFFKHHLVVVDTSSAWLVVEEHFLATVRELVNRGLRVHVDHASPAAGVLVRVFVLDSLEKWLFLSCRVRFIWLCHGVRVDVWVYFVAVWFLAVFWSGYLK